MVKDSSMFGESPYPIVEVYGCRTENSPESCENVTEITQADAMYVGVRCQPREEIPSPILV